MILLDTKDVADRLCVSAIRQRIRGGKIAAHNLGRDYAIEENALRSVKVYGKRGRLSGATKKTIEERDTR